MYDYDVIVIGAGHAGVEAALAAARIGADTAVVTLSRDSIARMPCNCSIGGPAKGHVVREIDALGGQMGLTTDITMTHLRMLNTGKGPAVQALRAQCDKQLYHETMRDVLEADLRIQLIEDMVDDLLIEDDRVQGIVTRSGQRLTAPSVVITTGTFLRGVIHVGDQQTPSGRSGEEPSVALSHTIRRLGFPTVRLKTGTTPRIAKESIDFSRTIVIDSQPDAPPFSFLNDSTIPRDLLPSWLTYTNERTHAVIRDNLGCSAMYGGYIEGRGPRYCPSIEDKIVKFASKPSHQVFLEQEGWATNSMYVQGMSTSLPPEIQLAFLHTVPGLEECVMMKAGYAVEYDAVPATELTHALMTKRLPGLFLAGQINGTSGYEEAAGQGLIAGVNAARHAHSQSPFILQRSESYIGVMIDDLVTKGADEPYRLLTSRAEYRLLLRHDNADLRLTARGREYGLVSDTRWDRFTRKRDTIDRESKRLQSTDVSPSDTRLSEIGIAPIGQRTTLWDLLKRPDVTHDQVAALAHIDDDIPHDVAEQVTIQARYAGYIRQQSGQVASAVRREEVRVPIDMDFTAIKALSTEGREKLGRVRPISLGQAGRIPGVTPADIAVLSVHIEQRRRTVAAGPA